MSSPKRVSMIPPPPAKGSFKIETTANGTVIATPSKQGIVQGSPSHTYNKETGKWTPLPSDLETMSKLSPISPPPPQSPTGIKSPGTTTGTVAANLFAAGLSSAPPKTAGHNSATTGPNTASTAAAGHAHYSASTSSASNPPSNDMQQLIKMLVDNDLINKAPNTTVTGEINIAIPRHDSKRGRDVCDKASVDLPASERCNIKQQCALSYLKQLRRASDCYFWGFVLNSIKTELGSFSLLWDHRKISLEDVTKEAEACWGSTSCAHDTNDPLIMQER